MKVQWQVIPHKDDTGFNIMLQAFPLDGKIVCRAITDDAETGDQADPPARQRGSANRSSSQKR